VQLVNTFADSYASGSVDNITGRDTEQGKKKLAIREPLQIPQFRPPTPYPEAEMTSPFSDSQHSPRPIDIPGLYSQPSFSNNFTIPIQSRIFSFPQQQQPTPTGVGTAQAYQSKGWLASRGRNSMSLLPPTQPSMYSRAPDMGNMAHGYPTEMQTDHLETENSGQGKPSNASEIYMMPPTPILRARELPDFVKFPPHSLFM
jgi:hypothetical protein